MAAEQPRKGFAKTHLEELYPLTTAFESARATRAGAHSVALFGEMDEVDVTPGPLGDDELDAMYAEWRERGLLGRP